MFHTRAPFFVYCFSPPSTSCSSIISHSIFLHLLRQYSQQQVNLFLSPHIMMRFFAAVLVVLLAVWETDAFVGSSLVPRAAASGQQQQRRAGTTVSMVRIPLTG